MQRHHQHDRRRDAEQEAGAEAAPQDVGYAFAGVWQGVLDVARSVANIKLPIDVNVASWLSPSESGTATQ